MATHSAPHGEATTEAEHLYRTVVSHLRRTDPGAALAIADSQWPQMRSREPNPHDAETCRLLALAAADLQPATPYRADVWRSRALSRFVLTGWHEGVAMIVMGQALAVLAAENRGYPNGRTLDVIRGSERALDVLDEMEPFLALPPSGIAVSPRSPRQDLLRRSLAEKQGLLQLLLGRFDEARGSYRQALDAADGNARGTLKVRAGLALVEYLDGAPNPARTETEAVAAEARGIKPDDVFRTAEQNLVIMNRRGRDLFPYDVL